jgi:hypothetical protein
MNLNSILIWHLHNHSGANKAVCFVNKGKCAGLNGETGIPGRCSGLSICDPYRVISDQKSYYNEKPEGL